MNVLEINHAVLYCSKLSEVEISVEEQLEKLRKFCKHFDLQIVREYVDTDIINKPLFNQLINCFTNNFHLLLLILAISINIISLSSELKKSNIILRHKNYRNYLEFCLRKNLMYVFLSLIIRFFF